MKIAKRIPPPWWNNRLTISIQYAVQEACLPPGRRLRRWARAALGPSPCHAEVTVRFVGEGEGRSLNNRHRGKDYATNVLTFPLHIDETASLGRQRIFGDIILCVPIILAEAQEFGRSAEEHCAHLVVHGMLHLQGYTHDDEVNASVMETLETSIMQNIGYADPYRAS